MLDVDESFRANCSFAGVVSQSHDDAEDEDKRKRQQNAKERAARQFKDGVVWSGNKATPSLFHSLLDTVSSNAVNTDSVYFKGIAEVVCMIILCVANDLTSDPENESRWRSEPNEQRILAMVDGNAAVCKEVKSLADKIKDWQHIYLGEGKNKSKSDESLETFRHVFTDATLLAKDRLGPPAGRPTRHTRLQAAINAVRGANRLAGGAKLDE